MELGLSLIEKGFADTGMGVDFLSGEISFRFIELFNNDFGRSMLDLNNNHR